jgi:cell volume regulation protein A
MLHFSTEQILLIVATLLLVSIFASIASSRLGIPSLLLFLLVGMLAGSDGLGGIYFDDPGVAQFLGVIALIFILFDGGVNTRWSSVRPVLWKGLGLSTLGVFLTALLLGWFSSWLLGFSLLEGFLLGAIVSSTDAAAVFSILRARSVSLKGNLQPLLELESGSNDPMAVFLTLGLVQVLSVPEASPLGLIPMFLQQMLFGVLLGYGLGRGMVTLVNRVRLDYEGLYPVLTLSLVTLSYGITTLLGGNGFLAVYISAIVMGNSEFIHKKSLIRFHEGVAWLMQIMMFLTLGLLVFPSKLGGIVPVGLLIAIFLMCVARPVSVFITLAFTRLNFREKAFLSWVGLRGAVPIILATFPLLAGLPLADTYFNVVFFIVLTSVLIQGTFIPWVSRWLGVDAPVTKKMISPLEFVPTGTSKNDLVEISVPAGSAILGKPIVQMGLPKKVLIVLVSREEEFLMPRGDTILEAGDTLLVLADKDEINVLREQVNTRSGPKE